MRGKVHALCSAVALVVAASGRLRAEEATAPTAPATPGGSTLASVLASSGITITGYLAASYYHSSGYNSFHEFDVHHDTFQLDQAGVQIGYQPKEGFGVFADVLAGEDARILNTAENETNSTFNVRQAYVQYAHGPLTLIGGKFTTLAAEEYSNPTSNTNFPRSFLFFAEPLTHTGVRATWAATSTLNLAAGVNNGWNTTSTSYGCE
jgi:Putative beta-barrel porin-2, OmpL-like. bbp2